MSEVTVRVQYFGLARNLAGKPREEISLSHDASVREMLTCLIDKYGDGFRAALMTGDWRLRRYARIVLDNRDIRETNGLDTRIGSNSDASIIVMIDPIIGGC